MKRNIYHKDVDINTVRYILEAIIKMPYYNGEYLSRATTIAYLQDLINRMKYQYGCE